MKKYLKEIEHSLKVRSKPKKSDADFQRLGMRVPEVRKTLKDTSYSFYSFKRREVTEVWDQVWKTSSHFEIMSMALYSYQNKPVSKTDFQKVKSWVDRVSCWGHSDDLSKIYANIVEKNPEWILPTLRKWNKSKNPWKRRQSVVSLIEYASKRKTVLLMVRFNSLFTHK